MRPSTIWYTLKQGIKNIKRNFMFSIASVITMAACIFLFGIFFSIVNNVNTLAHKVEEDVPITVLFNEGTTQEQMDAVGALISQRPEVSKIEFESGDEAWEKMKKEYFGDDSEAADGFKDDNPLANSSNYRVYMNNIEKQSELVAYIKTLDNVREVNQSEQAAKTLGSINRVVSYVSVAVIVILLIIAIFLISNTISVGITVRKDEIGIMKYIGATDGFVRAPFLLDGTGTGRCSHSSGNPVFLLQQCGYLCIHQVQCTDGGCGLYSGRADLSDIGANCIGTGTGNRSCGKLYYLKKTLEGVRKVFYNKGGYSGSLYGAAGEIWQLFSIKLGAKYLLPPTSS